MKLSEDFKKGIIVGYAIAVAAISAVAAIGIAISAKDEVKAPAIVKCYETANPEVRDCEIPND